MIILFNILESSEFQLSTLPLRARTCTTLCSIHFHHYYCDLLIVFWTFPLRARVYCVQHITCIVIPKIGLFPRHFHEHISSILIVYISFFSIEISIDTFPLIHCLWNMFSGIILLNISLSPVFERKIHLGLLKCKNYCR